MFLTFVTFAFKYWFLFAFISPMTMLVAIVALSIEFSFSITPTFVWYMNYLTIVIASRSLILLSSLFGRFTFFFVSNSYFCLLSIEILLFNWFMSAWDFIILSLIFLLEFRSFYNLSFFDLRFMISSIALVSWLMKSVYWRDRF